MYESWCQNNQVYYYNAFAYTEAFSREWKLLRDVEDLKRVKQHWNIQQWKTQHSKTFNILNTRITKVSSFLKFLNSFYFIFSLFFIFFHNFIPFMMLVWKNPKDFGFMKKFSYLYCLFRLWFKWVLIRTFCSSNYFRVMNHN